MLNMKWIPYLCFLNAVFILNPVHGAEKILIGFSQANFAEPWRQAMNEEIKKAAAEHPDVQIVFADAAQDNSKQVADVENFMRQRVDVLMISPNEAKPLSQIVQKAYDSKIPVIILDRKIIGDRYTSFIGADNRQIGKSAGEFVAQSLGGKGNLVEIKGLSGSTPAIERSEGFHEAIKKYPQIKILHSANADWLRDKARSQMEMALQAHGDQIDLVYAHNDPMAMGAYLAAKSKGLEKKIKFVGIDGLPGRDGGVKMVIDEKLSATFLYPTGGRKALEVALIAAQKKQVPKTITLSTEKITKANASQFYQ